MKIVTLRIFLLAGLLLALSCSKNESGRTVQHVTLYKPVYQSKSAVLAAINGNPGQPVAEAGKVYVKDHFIYLNEKDKGIHIIDNSNPSHPLQVAFLRIPGNLDMAVRDNILYADMYGDLLAIDISQPRDAKLRKRVPGFFSERMYVNNTAIPEDMVPVEWIKKDTLVIFDRNGWGIGCAACATANLFSASAAVSKGMAGSMAAMVLMDDYLYAITERHSLGIISIASPADPEVVNTIFAGFDLQTIFPFGQQLFLGSAIGMFMYDVSNPESPAYSGEFAHGRACDPVITDGSYAYVTLHGGTPCGGSSNELHIVDIRNPGGATLVKTYPLTKPTGLSKDDNILFVCDGSAGVRVYNASDPTSLEQIQRLTCKDPYDVIAMNGVALVVTARGLYQYDYTQPGRIRQLSVFAL